jgi:hypothetical protein
LDDQISGGALWLRVSDRMPGELYQWISPDSVARTMMVRSHALTEFHAVSEAVQVSIGGFAGPARVLATNDRDGRARQVIAFAVARQCLALTGILSEKDGAPTAIDRLDSFTGAIAVELYEPAPGKFTPPWRGPAPEFHAGDLRRLLQGEQP